MAERHAWGPDNLVGMRGEPRAERKMSANRSKAELSAIRKAAGVMSAVWLLLDDAVRRRKGDDDAISQLNTAKGQHLIESIADLLVGKVVQVAWNIILPWIIAACQLVDGVDQDITAERFPLQPDDLTIKNVINVAIPHSMSSFEVVRYLNTEGLRPATLVELLWWWLTNPTKQEDCLVVALGSAWGGRVPYIIGDVVDHKLCLSGLTGEWERNHTFAAVSKSAA